MVFFSTRLQTHRRKKSEMNAEGFLYIEYPQIIPNLEVLPLQRWKHPKSLAYPLFFAFMALFNVYCMAEPEMIDCLLITSLHRWTICFMQLPGTTRRKDPSVAMIQLFRC